MTREDVLAGYTGGGWDYPDVEGMADEIVRLRSILAALREPSDAALKAACVAVVHFNGDLRDVIIAAVEAAEREASV